MDSCTKSTGIFQGFFQRKPGIRLREQDFEFPFVRPTLAENFPGPKNHWILLWRGLTLYYGGFWDLQTISFEIPWFLGREKPTYFSSIREKAHAKTAFERWERRPPDSGEKSDDLFVDGCWTSKKKQWVPWRLPASLIGKTKQPFPAAQNQAIIFFLGEFFEWILLFFGSCLRCFLDEMEVNISWLGIFSHNIITTLIWFPLTLPVYNK